MERIVCFENECVRNIIINISNVLPWFCSNWIDLEIIDYTIISSIYEYEYEYEYEYIVKSDLKSKQNHIEYRTYKIWKWIDLIMTNNHSSIEEEVLSVFQEQTRTIKESIVDCFCDCYYWLLRTLHV